MRKLIIAMLAAGAICSLGACQKKAEETQPPTDQTGVVERAQPAEQTGVVERTNPDEQTGVVERTNPEEQ